MNDERKSKTKSKIKRNSQNIRRGQMTHVVQTPATPKGLKSHRKRKIWGKKGKFMA